MLANRNGFFYVLDRVTGELLVGKPFTDTTWAREIGPDGHPIVLNDGTKGCVPDQWGGTNFMPPSFDPDLGLFFLTARETCATYVPAGCRARARANRTSAAPCVWMRSQGYGALRAIDPRIGRAQVGVPLHEPEDGGRALDGVGPGVRAATTKATSWRSTPRPGKNLWHFPTGSPIWGAAAMTYMLDGTAVRDHPVRGLADGLHAGRESGLTGPAAGRIVQQSVRGHRSGPRVGPPAFQGEWRCV